jgi:hypothetical protein
MTTNEPPPSGNQPNPHTNDLPSYGSVPPPEGSYPPPPSGGYPPPPAPGGYGAAPEANKKALWSMILGIISLICFGIVVGPIAIVLSIMAKKEIEASGGRQTGGGQATAGLVLGILGAVFTVLYLIFVFSS